MLYQLLRDAISMRELRVLTAAVEVANNMELDTSEVIDAKNLVNRLMEENALVSRIIECIPVRDLDVLVNLLKRASELSLDNPSIREAQMVVNRIEEENRCLERLQEASSNKNYEELGIYLAKSTELGLMNHTEVQYHSTDKYYRIRTGHLLIKLLLC